MGKMSSLSDNIEYANAIRQPDGSYINKHDNIAWYNEEGQLHKEDGHAVIWANGNSYWFLNGIQYTFNEWLKLTPITDEQKLLLRLQYA
jgi:hypothetical protein